MTVEDNITQNSAVNHLKAEDLFGSGGILQDVIRRMVQEALQAELTHFLGYNKHDQSGHQSGNSRNGFSSKTLKTEYGAIELDIPRDRNNEFEPELIPKQQRRLESLNEKIVSMYALGMSTRDTAMHIKSLYGFNVSKDLITKVTAHIIEDAKQWQSRPLESVYTIVYLDATFVKIRDHGHVVNKAIYVVIGVKLNGHKDVLGLWIGQTEGAKFWLQILTDLRNRGVQDIFIACIDGLKGFPEAIEAVFPKTTVQLCVVHMIRNTLKYVSYKERQSMASGLKEIYKADTVALAEIALDRFETLWTKYPMASKCWRNNWEHIKPFFAYPEEIRRIIYTTNTIESLNSCYKKVTKQKKSFPSEDAALKSLYLATQKQLDKWTKPIQNWPLIYNVLAVTYKERMPIN